MFLLDTLDNMPCLHISNALMKVFLWVLKEGGANYVPLFDHLRSIQQKLRTQGAVRSHPCKSSQENIFYLNNPWNHKGLLSKSDGFSFLY
jgi:hypothetical protein